jgi:GNAT superfamily N-acetyltransferase
METSMLSTRAATIADVPLLRRLIQELAEYERESEAVLITEDELRRDGFGPGPKFRAILAEQDGRPAGFAVFFTSYSTWTGSGLFLEDLFVRETFRGRVLARRFSVRWPRSHERRVITQSVWMFWTGTNPRSSSTSPLARSISSSGGTS